MRNIFFNAHHSPVGAFASFTLGFPGPNGGLGLELSRPAEQNIYIGCETTPGRFEALPFFQAPDVDEAARYDVEADGDDAPKPQVLAIAKDRISRDFNVATDTWTAGDLTFRVISPVRNVPDPATATDEKMKEVLCPAVLAELTLDNLQGEAPRKAFFGFQGNDPYSSMRRLDPVCDLKGIGQGQLLAIASNDEFISSGQGFNIEAIVAPEHPENLVFGLGGTAALMMDVPAGTALTARFAICFYRHGTATANLPTRYLYTQHFGLIEEVAAYALEKFDFYLTEAEQDNAMIADSKLSDDQKFQLAHAIRSYY